MPSFVLFVLMRSTEPGCFRSCSWSLWKALDEQGASAWFHGIWTCGVEVLEYWMIFSLIIKVNSWKFQRNWNVLLVWLERSWWAGFNGIYLVRLDSECGRSWFLSVFVAENSNKFQKTRFWKEKSVENVVTLGPTAQVTQATLVNI